MMERTQLEFSDIGVRPPYQPRHAGRRQWLGKMRSARAPGREIVTDRSTADQYPAGQLGMSRQPAPDTAPLHLPWLGL